MNDQRIQRRMDHPSYRRHRKQVWTQILLPILIAALIFIVAIVLASLATFRGHGDVDRWAAISTIWLTLPLLLVGLILLLVLMAMIYLMARILALIPPYSLQAQRFVYRIEAYIKQAAGMFRKPVLALQELVKLARTYIERAMKARAG